MSDLISREALIEKLEEYIEYDTFDLYKEEPLICLGFEQLEDIICSQPTVEAKEVVHAKWVDDTGYLHSVRQYKCSNCGNEPLYNLGHLSIRSNFCPYCGADMRGEKHE